MPGATIATWNTNFRDPPGEVARNLGRLLGRCQVAGLTEARSEGVDTALEAAGWSEARRGDSSDRLVWDPAIWRPRGPRGVVQVHGDGPGKYLPAREVTWTTLEHRGSGACHTFLLSHVTSGYAVPDELPYAKWRDRAAKRHLLTLVEVTARLLVKPRVEYLHLLGDLNAKPSRVGAWWYPVRLFDALYVEDTEAGLDYLLHTRDARERGLVVARRWTEDLGAEGIHPAHYKRVMFPRQGGGPESVTGTSAGL